MRVRGDGRGRRGSKRSRDKKKERRGERWFKACNSKLHIRNHDCFRAKSSAQGRHARILRWGRDGGVGGVYKRAAEH